MPAAIRRRATDVLTTVMGRHTEHTCVDPPAFRRLPHNGHPWVTCDCVANRPETVFCPAPFLSKYRGVRQPPGKVWHIADPAMKDSQSPAVVFEGHHIRQARQTAGEFRSERQGVDVAGHAPLVRGALNAGLCPPITQSR